MKASYHPYLSLTVELNSARLTLQHSKLKNWEEKDRCSIQRMFMNKPKKKQILLRQESRNWNRRKIECLGKLKKLGSKL